METLKITSYTDDKFEKKHLDTLEVAFVPNSLVLDKAISYLEDKQLGNSNGSKIYKGYEPKMLSFDLIFDCTGVIEGTKEGDKVKDKVEELEKHLYLFNVDAHRPSFVKIAYGEFIFNGQLTKMNEKYTHFSNKGIPVRAEVKLEFMSYISSSEESKQNSRQSPDMSRIITMKEGDTLAALCQQIYENSFYVTAVARFNELNGFRGIPAGTKILFPPLKKE